MRLRGLQIGMRRGWGGKYRRRGRGHLLRARACAVCCGGDVCGVGGACLHRDGGMSFAIHLRGLISVWTWT